MTENRDFGSSPVGQPGRDPRLAWFASGGQYDQAVPSAAMTRALEDVTGQRGRPSAAANADEVTGIMAGWAATESRAAARKLAAVREIIRRHAGGSDHLALGDLPRQWDIDVAHEVAAALGISWQAAEHLVNFAWDLEGRLPQTGQLLDDGILSYYKAKIVSEEFAVLDDDKAPEAEQRLLARILDPKGRLRDGMTPAEIRRTCQRIVCTVDAAGAAKRREAAEREDARVKFFRNHGGAGALFAEGLPADEALMGEANIAKRAKEYRAAGIYPGHTMDMLRVLALVDTINGRSLEERIAIYRAGHPGGSTDNAPDTDDETPGKPDPRDGEDNRDTGGQDDDEERGYGDDDDDHEPGDHEGPNEDNGPDGADGPDGPDGDGGDGNGPGGGDGGVPVGRPDPGLPSLTNLTLPLVTLEGLAERPGEAPGYGALDPELTRKLAASAAASPRSKWCLTITSPEGYAVAHGCARLIRGRRPPSRDGPPPGGWDLVPEPGRPGPDGGYGAWLLTLPDGRRYRIDLHAIPVEECDHRYETDGYRPSNLLRHLVQVRDGQCTSPSCSMPARLCDFEHAKPHDEGGKTDACNAGARSRRCHRVKQKRGWTVTQPRPGWHRWQAPSGRAYTKGPMRYPA